MNNTCLMKLVGVSGVLIACLTTPLFAADILLHLPMEGTSSTEALKDTAGSGCVAIPHGNPHWEPSGGHDGGGAFEFDGDDDLSVGESFPVNSSYTKVAWVYWEGNIEQNAGNNIISGDTNPGGHAFWCPKSYGNRLSAGHNGHWNIVQDKAPLLQRQWVFVALTYDQASREMVLYRDGKPVDQAKVALQEQHVTDPTLSIGSFGYKNGWTFRGRIDDVQIYRRALSEHEIQNLFGASGSSVAVTPAPTPTLLASEPWQEEVEGFVLWESNRTGNWRIWIRDLNGNGLRQLVSDEEGRDHFCPHLSPDGRYLLYLSYPKGQQSYQEPQPRVPLHLFEMATSADRILVEEACAYGEDRAAVWLNDDTFVYIGADGLTYQYDLGTNQQTLLTPKRPQTSGWAFGWLINPTKTYATTGEPTFSPYDARAQTISPRQKQDGCQPYFSRDGKWGYWMGGAGGPIRAINLATREVKTIIEKNDPRMPQDRGYLYFPMLSADERLFAFGSSPNQHDHFSSDYDIFVAPINAETMELTGKPVRFTFNATNDRFPEAFARALALGQHTGEAPFMVSLEPKDQANEWQWDFGDGKSTRAKAVKHTYHEPGEYHIQAQQGDRTLIGHVQVLPTHPPKPLEAALINERQIRVRFNEPIRVDKSKAQLKSGIKVKGWDVPEDGYWLVLNLEKPLKQTDELQLEGIMDRAQHSNRMSKQQLEVRPPVWPGSQDGLVFLWQNGREANLVQDATTGRARSYALRPHGLAHLDHNYAMLLSQGAYLAEGVDDALLHACRATNQLTVEAVVSSNTRDQGGPARIVSFSSDPGARNFTLGQQDENLIFRLRTPNTGANGTNPEVTLCPLPIGKPVHVLVTYRSGQLRAYRDGELMLETDSVQGDFSNWSAHHLLFGDEWTGDRYWAGSLEGVAIYSRVLSPEEVHAHAQNYRSLLLAHTQPERWTVEARAIAVSDPPTLDQISPYREALIMNEYQVVHVSSRTEASLPARIRVVAWAILDGETLPDSKLKPGMEVHLTVEPFDANPQLERIYLADTLEMDLTMPIYYAVREAIQSQ